MNTITLVKILQIVVSIVIVLLVLLQTKGGGLSSAIGGSISAYRSKRGIEKGMFFLIIFLGLVLIVNSLMIVLVS